MDRTGREGRIRHWLNKPLSNRSSALMTHSSRQTHSKAPCKRPVKDLQRTEMKMSLRETALQQQHQQNEISKLQRLVSLNEGKPINKCTAQNKIKWSVISWLQLWLSPVISIYHRLSSCHELVIWLNRAKKCDNKR